MSNTNTVTEISVLKPLSVVQFESVPSLGNETSRQLNCQISLGIGTDFRTYCCRFSVVIYTASHSFCPISFPIVLVV